MTLTRYRLAKTKNSTWNWPETLHSSGSTAASAATTPVLKVPKPMIMKEARVMSLPTAAPR